MSEYVTVEVESTPDPDVMLLWVNQNLTYDDEEIYNTPEEGEVGSPIAQLLFIDLGGIQSLTIRPDQLVVRREKGVPWEALIDDIRDALRDFFL